MENLRTIRVTGHASIHVLPDQICINMTIEGKQEKYETAVDKSSEKTLLLKRALEKIGFAADDIRTTDYSVDPEYEGYDDKGNWKQRFVGYRYRHSMRFVFDSDKDKLGQVFAALASCEADPEFRVSYQVKDQEKAKSELLAKAVSDAKTKALVLAEASGVSLKEIHTIDYGFDHLDMEMPFMNYARAAGGPILGAKYAVTADSMDIDVNPADIELSDNVTVVWEIT